MFDPPISDTVSSSLVPIGRLYGLIPMRIWNTMHMWTCETVNLCFRPSLLLKFVHVLWRYRIFQNNFNCVSGITVKSHFSNKICRIRNACRRRHCLFRLWLHGYLLRWSLKMHRLSRSRSSSTENRRRICRYQNYLDKFDHLSSDKQSVEGFTSSEDDLDLPILARLENAK